MSASRSLNYYVEGNDEASSSVPGGEEGRNKVQR